jgi:ribosomal protein S16
MSLRSLIIRFKPLGRAHKKFFRIVVTQKFKAATKAALDVLGWYDPYTKTCSLNVEKIKPMIANNIEISNSVKALFVKEGLIAPTIYVAKEGAVATKPKAKAKK